MIKLKQIRKYWGEKQNVANFKLNKIDPACL